MIDLAHHFCHAMKIADQARRLRHAQASGTSVKRCRCRGLRKRGRYVRVRPSLRVRARFGLAQFGKQRQQQKQDENIGISVHKDVPLHFNLDDWVRQKRFLGYHMKILRAWCINWLQSANAWQNRLLRETGRGVFGADRLAKKQGPAACRENQTRARGNDLHDERRHEHGKERNYGYQ